MVIILKDNESMSEDVVFITETTTGEQIEDIINETRATIGDTDNYDWELIESKLPNDVKCYTSWNNEFDVIVW